MRILIATIIILSLTSAQAQSPVLPGPGLPIATIIPPTCSGTIDLSTGCAQGMFGGL